jgi:hypothetical protein
LAGPQSSRRTTKNADHQTIPRFEQLIDLGFVEKPRGSDDEVTSYKTLPPRRWKYQPTARCRAWGAAIRGRWKENPRWIWERFAEASVKCGLGTLAEKPERPNPAETVGFLSHAYQAVRRPIGHTPLESVALLAMLLAADQGFVLEMAELHAMVLNVKKRGLFQELFFFASGNDLDKMFVVFKPGFDQALVEVFDQVRTPTP